MKKISVCALAAISVLAVSAVVWAGSDTGGLGAMAGKTDGHNEGALVVEGNNNFVEHGGLYGSSNVRLEAGSGFGIALSSFSGSRILGLRPGEHIAFHAGLEPFDLNLSWNTNDHRRDFIEWSPMGSAGVDLAADSCRILVLARGGASIGTLGGGGARWAYGGGLSGRCPGFNMAALSTRIEGHKYPTDISSLDLAFKVPRRNASIGLRGEVLDEHEDKKDVSIFAGPQQSDRLEYRGFLILRYPASTAAR